jgi:hypothetical protein
MERCPICRARLRDATCCPRCGADLALPLETEQRALAMERGAVGWIAQGAPEQAEWALREALRLRSSPFARALLGLLARDANALRRP